jgi:glycosyltransferase involved in cell wall biosynthesis
MEQQGIEVQLEGPSGPRVSVVIVSQSQVMLLRATLTALAARQEPQLSEVIVVDCGSYDGSPRLDEEFEGVTFLRLPRNFGWTKAVNIATRTAKGEYLFLLPNGCQVETDTIQRLVAGLEADSQAGAVCPLSEGKALPQGGASQLRPMSGERIEYPFDLPVLFPKVALVSMNYLPSQYGQYIADAELFLKMKQAGKVVKVLADVSVGRDRLPLEGPDAEVAEADRLSGLASYYSRNEGFMSGVQFWLGQCFGLLFSGRFGLFSKVLGGAKIDGM